MIVNMKSILTQDERLVIITGAFRGIGNMLFQHLNSRYSVYPVCRTEEQLESLRHAGAEEVMPPLGFHGDLNDPETVRELAARCIATNRGVYAVIHCFGPIMYSHDAIPEWPAWESMLQQNLSAAVHLIRAFTNLMGPGRILLFGFSGLGTHRGYKNIAAYAAAKEALNSLARSASRALAERDVTINVIAPGIFLTETGEVPRNGARMLPSVPLGRPGTAEDITGVVEWLLSTRSRYVTGQVIKVSGGLHIF